MRTYSLQCRYESFQNDAAWKTSAKMPREITKKVRKFYARRYKLFQHYDKGIRLDTGWWDGVVWWWDGLVCFFLFRYYFCVCFFLFRYYLCVSFLFRYYSCVCFFLLLHPCCFHARSILCRIHTPCMGAPVPAVHAKWSRVFLSFSMSLQRLKTLNPPV